MNENAETSSVRAFHWCGDHLLLLDQRALPDREQWIEARDADAVAAAIRDMVVRGAPAIGIAAAYGVALAALRGDDPGTAAGRLTDARPTAINLAWALDRMRRCADDGGDAQALVAEAERIHGEDLAINRRIGAHGAPLLAGGGAVITHCNTGSLATGGHGTALGVIRSAWAAGYIHEVFAGETRPWLQGARLTAWELLRDGIPVRVMVDGAAAALMQQGGIRAVITGADRVAANGDVANKIGTCGLAILARHYGIPFLVAAPISTIDAATASGREIPIEERPADEVLTWSGKRVAPAGTQARNPVFDVTPAALIDALVTERGVVRQPTGDSIATMLAGPVDTPASTP